MGERSDENEKSRFHLGQYVVKRFSALQKGKIPHLEREKYLLEISSEVHNPKILNLEDLKLKIEFDKISY